MQPPAREPSMEDILASIKKVIAEEKEMRSAVPAPAPREQEEPPAGDPPQEDVLELDEPLAPPMDLGPPLLDENAAGHSRQALEQLSTVAASVPPPPPVNPLEEMVRDMLRPLLKQWLDDHLPREITRITGRPL
jgi:cell pole-organizing protein PopZ